MQEWIDARRKELEAQRDQMVGSVNQAIGALKMLDALQAELNKPKPEDKAAE